MNARDFEDQLMGDTLVYDENGKRVRLSDIPGGVQIQVVKVEEFTFQDLKKAFEELL